MAKTFVSSDGRAVIARLTFREVEALEALLSRVGEETNQPVFEALHHLGEELREQRDDLHAAGLIPGEFEAFREAHSPLSDPDAPEQLALFDMDEDEDDVEDQRYCGFCARGDTYDCGHGE